MLPGEYSLCVRKRCCGLPMSAPAPAASPRWPRSPARFTRGVNRPFFLRGTDAIKQIRIADGPLATRCNVQFRADGKSQRARGRRLVRQCSRCPYSATSKLCRSHQNPSTCKASALQPPAQRARRPDPHMDDRNGPAVRCGPRSAPRFREWGLGWG
jgi:hypothetical protein